MGVLGPRELLGPGRGVLKGEATQDAADNLIGAFGLAICLGVKIGRETGRGPNQVAKLLPKLGGELGTPVRNYIGRKTVKFENMINHYLSSLLGGGEFREGNEVRGF